jgi:hypothetical protein
MSKSDAMGEKLATAVQSVWFERTLVSVLRRFHTPSLPMGLVVLVVGFLVLTPLSLMILNSFQIARPGQPVVWGLEG